MNTITYRHKVAGVGIEAIPPFSRPHPVCLSVALALGHGAYPSQKSIFAIFRTSLFEGNRKGDISQSCGRPVSHLETNIDIALEELFLMMMHLIWYHGARRPLIQLLDM